jgi:carbon-monoxide dehydrogenase small subunit
VSTHHVRITVNGVEHQGTVVSRATLADFLREDLELTGTHVACEHGVCGACTVLVDGDAIRACLLFAVQADGAEILTIEGLERDGELHPLQASLRECHSFQCGFCTPGFVMSAYALLRDGAPAIDGAERTDAEWREALAGNLCRCTGYQSIVEGVKRAATAMRADADADAAESGPA